MKKLNILIICTTALLLLCFGFKTANTSLPISQFSRSVPHKNIDIQKIMDYPMHNVIARYCKDYHVSEADAQVHERELKRFFILASKYPDDNLDMLSLDVDNLWHTFLLFTKEYQTFCNDMLGTFIHHTPKIDTQKQN